MSTENWGVTITAFFVVHSQFSQRYKSLADYQGCSCYWRITQTLALLVYLRFGIKGLRADGTITPSSVWLFSNIAHIVLVVAHMVAFNMCTYSTYKDKFCFYYNVYLFTGLGFNSSGFPCILLWIIRSRKVWFKVIQSVSVQEITSIFQY